MQFTSVSEALESRSWHDTHEEEEEELRPHSLPLSLGKRKKKNIFSALVCIHQWRSVLLTIVSLHGLHAGAYDDEDAAARAYDLAALKYWGPDTILNFPVPPEFTHPSTPTTRPVSLYFTDSLPSHVMALPSLPAVLSSFLFF
jgi:hypothetical protein